MSPAARSAFAVIDGLLLYVALRAAFYAVAFLGLNYSFDTPTAAYLGANLAWALLSATLAGYTAARVAHRKPIAHGLAVAVPFLLLIPFNLYKGLGGRHTPFVVSFNLLVPVAILLGAWFFSLRRTTRRRPRL